MSISKEEIKEIDKLRKATHLSIPLEFVDSDEYDFTPIELLLISTISSFSDEDNACFASNEYFAKKFNVSEVTVSKAISRLISKGYVELIHFDGRKRTIACIIDTRLNAKRRNK